MPDEVLVEHAGGVTVVTINRPAARNAVNRAVTDGIAAALEEFEARKDLTVAILTGTGGTFCSGMDLKAFVAGEDVTHPERGFAGITLRPPHKPVIAAVEGYALAGGCEIALACDLIVAAEDARFGIPEVKRGLVAGAGGLIRLPRRVPHGVAMRLALTGETVTAAQAERYSLVTELTAPGKALDGARALAAAIAANAPLAVAATKRVLDGQADWTSAEAFDRQAEILRPVITSADAREGATAFAEKRPPVWRGE
ncbi:crotonase/enoyl-CoA hydratase family protein [Actinomadura monticuli]|uniref:Crotonase/enoyl-CoA hydratase family protein n=1 Tax=Actinomadura monticuli TaxID=3097367 RepID=A0ABV4Q4T1_9ACTN